MAAILDQEDNLDFQAVAEGVRKALPAYARPMFIRALRQVEMTGVFPALILLIYLVRVSNRFFFFFANLQNLYFQGHLS